MDFTHTFSCERPFKFLRHLVRPLGIDNVIPCRTETFIALYLIWHGTDKDTDKDMDKDTDEDEDKYQDKVKDTDSDTDW